MPDTDSPTKKAIDAQSGRFEFFKQSLTLGSAGVAGTAALFTDPTKIPFDLLSKYLICVFGFLLLMTVVFAIWGISTYANLLKALDAGEDATVYREGMIKQARRTYFALSFTILALIAFAGFRLFTGPQPLTPDAAIDLARRTINSAAGGQTQPIKLDNFEVDKRNYIITYSVGAPSLKYVVRVNQDTNGIELISQETPVPRFSIWRPWTW